MPKLMGEVTDMQLSKPAGDTMVRNIVRILGLGILAGVVAIAACGDSSTAVPSAGSIAGEVTLEGRGLDGVTATLSNGTTATTAADGSFRFDGIGPGTYQVSISGHPAHAAFRATSVSATVGAEGGLATVAFGASNTDRDALAALYNATDGPNWVNNDNWLTDAPLGEWYGVDTDASGRVIGLDLSGYWDSDKREIVRHGLKGPIPPELANLASLQRLDFIFNYLSGPIPPEIGNLGSLERLNLTANQLTGPIPPEIGSLGSLESLTVQANRLTGPIPSEIGNLGSLERLDLHGNQLTGPIPPEIGNLGSLKSLVLTVNQLTGPIPPGVGNLANLTHLSISTNDLAGPVPSELGSLTKLQWLSIDRNKALSGPLPLSLEGVPLVSSKYHNTGICVPLEASFRTWLASIEDHQGTGVDCRAPQSDRDILEILYNATDGPNWVNNDNWLTDAPLGEWYGVDTDASGRVIGLDLSGYWDSDKREIVRHGLKGPIPPELANLASLQRLDFIFNYLSGPIPPEIGNLGSLERLNLTDNQLTGPIPPEIGSLGSLESLAVQANRLTGPIPSEIGNLGSLDVLDLQTNQLTGPIPPEIGSLGSLRSLGLTGNRLTGPIPPGVGNLANLTRLWISANDLAGPVPSELGSLTKLQSLSIDDNKALSGPMPLSLEGVPLVSFKYHNTGLCVPLEASFRAWLASIETHQGTGVDCQSDRDILEILYNATDGPNWKYSTNWLTDAPLDEWHGVRTDPTSGRVTQLELFANEVTGEIPPDVGDLSHLSYLDLDGNNLSGSIPPELDIRCLV